MSIKEITITNFLSYKSQSLTLSPHLNIFVGRNGSGKSNFFNSLLFVLADKFQLRGEERKMVENNIVQGGQEDIGVQLRLDNTSKKIPIQTNEVIIYRRWSEKDEYFLNGKTSSLQTINNILQCLNLNRSNPYNIIRQGRITKIANMRDVDLYEFLEEITGVKFYEQKKQEALDQLQQLKGEKDEIVKMLKDLSEQIKQIENEREAFKSLDEIRKQIQIYEVQLSMISTKNIRHNLLDINAEQSKLYAQIKELRNQETAVQEELYKIKRKVENKEANYDHLSQKHHSLGQELQLLLHQRNDTERLLKQYQQKYDQLSQTVTQMDEELESNQNYLSLKNELVQKEALFKEHQSRTLALQAQVEGLQLLFSKDPIAVIKEQIQQETIQKKSYEKDLQGLKQRHKQISLELQKIKVAESDREDPRVIKNKLANFQQEHKQILEQQDQVQKEIMETAKQRQNIQMTLYKVSNELEYECKNFDTRLKDIFTQSIFSIMDFAKSTGFDDKIFGVVAQLMNIQNQRLIPMVETAAGQKLYSLVVQDSETAKKIIDFNKQNHGCTLRIYSLDLLSGTQGKENYPKDAIVLADQVQFQNIPETKMEILKQKILGKWLCVRDYETALSIAGPNNANCVTLENEVVFSEGFLTRVGATKQQMNGATRVMQFKKIIQQKFDKTELEKKDLMTQQKLDRLNDQVLGYQRQILQIKTLSDQLTVQLKSQDRSQVNAKEVELQQLEKLINSIQETIDGSTNRLLDMEKQLKNPKSLKATAKDEEKLQKLQREQTASSKEMTVSYNQLHELKKKLHHFERIHADQDLKKAEKENSQNLIQQFQSKINDLLTKHIQLDSSVKLKEKEHAESTETIKKVQQSLTEAQEEKQKILKSNEDIQVEIEQIQNHLNSLEQQSSAFLKKIEQANQEQQNLSVFQEVEEVQEKQKGQLIRKVKELKQKFNQKFTEKDKILFEKLDNIEQKFDQFQRRFELLKESESEFDEFCKVMDSKTLKMINEELFKRFQHEFTKIFLSIVPTGKCQVRLIRTAKKNKRNNMPLFGIDIRVTFKGDGEVQNWYTLSQGEKTVIAFTIVIALQKCEPAPFYILDEFDAALDDNYRQQIANLIYELSKESQFLIITFRPELLNLQDSTNVSYFKVFFSNQMSSIRKTTQQEAKLIIQTEKKD